MATYHLLLDALAFGGIRDNMDCHVTGCIIFAHRICVRCYENFCDTHSTGTLKTVSYGRVNIPLCFDCITPQEQEANRTNTPT